MSDLFHHAEVLRALHHREPGFNLFSVLRTSSDEVFLHSRFLAFLLNPQGSHGCGSTLLQTFLKVMKVDDFDTTTAKVQAEYKSIDIFISNAAGHAIVLENKIYANDAYEQLVRYNQLVQREGYQHVSNLYLTLTGSEPAQHSKGNLDVALISYQTDIINWLEQCVPFVARDAGLREAIFQYIELLKKLTSTDQGGPYMDALKKKLLEGDNLLLVADIGQAYTEVLVDLQADLWQRMRDYQKATYPYMPTPEDRADRNAIRNYYVKSKNNRCYGLYYPLTPTAGYAYIELNYSLYVGYTEVDVGHSEDRKTLLELSRELLGSAGTEEELYWRYPSINLNFRNLTREDLNRLRNPEQRQEIAQDLVDGVYQLWTKATATDSVKTLKPLK